jgi:hypothetical protein
MQIEQVTRREFLGTTAAAVVAFPIVASGGSSVSSVRKRSLEG